MSFFKTYLKVGYLAYILLFPCISISAQQLLDDFDRANSGAVGNGWIEGGTGSTGAIVSNELGLGTNSTSGQDYIYQDVSSLYTTTLDYSTSTVTWAVNMSQSRSNPSGFNSGNYGIAFILGGTSSDFTTGNGYAVVLGQSGSPDLIRLVYYTGGLDLNSNLTDIISGNDYGTEHLNIRVTFNPTGNNWSLYVESGASFSDPTAVITQIGSTTSNEAYTTSSLDFVGCYYNHNNGGGEDVQFDNFYIPSTPAVKMEPTNHPTSFSISATSGTTLNLTWADAIGAVAPDFYLIKGSATSFAAIVDPVDGIFEIDGILVRNVTQGTQTVDLTGLSLNTTYYFKIYSYSNTGSNADFKTDGTIQQDSGATDALPNAWLNEFHYQDVGADEDEFVEIIIEDAGSLTLSDFTVTLYNGSSGSSYNTTTVDNYTSGATTNNFTPYSFNYTDNAIAIQNGEPDGIALSYSGSLLMFLSYGGTFTASGGDADGVTSTDVGVTEPSNAANGSSLYLSGQGAKYSDFDQPWLFSSGTNTRGAQNSGQTLPVELVSFEVSMINNSKNVLLKWETASELKNDYFEVQRSSNAEDFYSIGKVEGIGYSNSLIRYSFEDKTPLNNANYYRLKQIDFDGAFEYSNVNYININSNNDPFIVYPNPSSGDFFLKTEKTYISNYKLNLYSTKGNIVHSENISFGRRIKINLPTNISEGVYIIELSSNDGVWRKRIVKK